MTIHVSQFSDPLSFKAERPTLTLSAPSHFEQIGTGIHPAVFAADVAVRPNAVSAGPVAPLPEPIHGTTTLGFVFNGGVLIAVDSRSTQGPYVASQTVKKILEISSTVIGTMAGGAADCAFWEQNLSREIRTFELQHGRRVSVCAASKMLANTLYQYKGMGLSVGTMIAGVDAEGAHLYYVDNDGARVRGNLFSVGSGSTYAYGVLDTGYRPDLNEEEAIALGRKSIYHATHRDAMSGGYINIYVVKADGWRRLPSEDCYNVHYGEQEPGVHS